VNSFVAAPYIISDISRSIESIQKDPDLVQLVPYIMKEDKIPKLTENPLQTRKYKMTTQPYVPYSWLNIESATPPYIQVGPFEDISFFGSKPPTTSLSEADRLMQIESLRSRGITDFSSVPRALTEEERQSQIDEMLARSNEESKLTNELLKANQPIQRSLLPGEQPMEIQQSL